MFNSGVSVNVLTKTNITITDYSYIEPHLNCINVRDKVIYYKVVTAVYSNDMLIRQI